MGSIPCGQDSGFGSDSEHLRFLHYDQHSTTSHRQLTCLSRQPTITKNLSFIPFDVFLTASSITLMTYVMTQASGSATEPPEHIAKKFLNIPKKDPEHIKPQMPELVRQIGGGMLQPLLFLQFTQPSTLLSCHQRRQRLEVSLFDLTLKGVASDYSYLGRVPYFFLHFTQTDFSYSLILSNLSIPSFAYLLPMQGESLFLSVC